MLADPPVCVFRDQPDRYVPPSRTGHEIPCRPKTRSKIALCCSGPNPTTGRGGVAARIQHTSTLMVYRPANPVDASPSNVRTLCSAPCSLDFCSAASIHACCTATATGAEAGQPCVRGHPTADAAPAGWRRTRAGHQGWRAGQRAPGICPVLHPLQKKKISTN